MVVVDTNQTLCLVVSWPNDPRVLEAGIHLLERAAVWSLSFIEVYGAYNTLQMQAYTDTVFLPVCFLRLSPPVRP